LFLFLYLYRVVLKCSACEWMSLDLKVSG